MTAARAPLGRILTFYSYKGGTGRSMALANIAWILASSGRSVLVIDWDLEAPGLHRYFRPFLLDEELTASDGLIDLVDRYATAAIQPVDPSAPPKADWYLEYTDFSDYVLSIDYDYFGPSGRLDFLPAGRQGDAYALKVSSFNWQNLYDRLGGGAFFEAFKRRAREEYDYILIDSRTGVSDTAGICSVQMPDALVVCFTYNNQSIKGAAGVAQWATNRRELLLQELRTTNSKADPSGASATIEDSPRPYRIFPVPMRVDAGESDRLALRQAFARAAFRPLTQHLGADLADYWSRVEVPHNVFYAYEEVLSAFKDNPGDPKTVLSAFVRMTSYITDRDVSDYRLTIEPEVRQRYIEAFATTASAGRPQAQAAPAETEDEALVRTTEAALSALTDEQRALARRIVGRLVRIGREEEGGGLFAIRTPISDFSDGELAVIRLLQRYGIVSVVTAAPQAGSSGRTVPGTTVGFANEKVLRLSRTIGAWLDGDREFLLWRQQLRTYVADWERSGREKAALLGGTLLAEATLWQRRRKDDLNQAEIDYLRLASVTLQQDVEAVPHFQLNRPAAAAPPSASQTLARAPAPVALPAKSGLPRWLGISAAAAAAAIALFTFWFLRSPAGPTGVQSTRNVREAVIVAAATAATDPLQRALLLLELGPDADAPSNAKDLAIDLATTTLPYALLRNDGHPITVGRFGSDGNSFATGSTDGTLKVWGGGRPPVTIASKAGGIVSVAIDPKLRQVLATGRNQLAEVWALDSPREVKRLTIASNFLEGTLHDDLPVVVQPAGGSRGAAVLVAGFKGQRADEYRPEDFSTLVTLPAGTTSVRFNTTGDWVAVVRLRSIDVWQLSGGRLLRSFEVPSPPHSTVLSPNGAYLAYATDSGGVSVVAIAGSSAPARSAPAYADRVQAPPRPSIARQAPVAQTTAVAVTERPIAVSPDGQVVVFALADGTAVPVTVAGGIASPPSPRQTGDRAGFRGHQGAIVSGDFSIDGRLIATSGGDGVSRLWENPIGRAVPARPPSSTPWNELWRTLRDRTTACLSADERMRLLNEAEATAREAAGKCDADYGRKLFAAPVQAS